MTKKGKGNGKGKGKGKGKVLESQRVNQHSARNEMYHVRLQQMLSRTVHPERCIDLTYVDGSDVVRLADAIGWRQFVITPRTTANFSIVRESYTSMIFEEYHKGKPVKVRGVDVFVCPQEINGYYDTAAHAALKKGMPDNMIFQLYHLELATTLRRNMDNMGEWSVNRSLRQSELEKDLAFWSVSISHSLRTFMQRTKTVLEVAQILYCIKHQLQIDVGQQICDAIYRARKKSTSILPFPCMITDLCLRAGVALSNDDEIKGLSEPCNSNTFIDVTEEIDVERLLSMGSRKRQRML